MGGLPTTYKSWDDPPRSDQLTSRNSINYGVFDMAFLGVIRHVERVTMPYRIHGKWYIYLHLTINS